MRRRWPTKGRISSGSIASHSWRWAFSARRRDQGGPADCAVFYRFGHPHVRHASHAHNAAVRVSLDHQLFDLRVAKGPCHHRQHKAGLVATRRASVVGVALATAIAPDVFTAVSGAGVVPNNHQQLWVFHHLLDHRLLQHHGRPQQPNQLGHQSQRLGPTTIQFRSRQPNILRAQYRRDRDFGCRPHWHSGR